MFCETFFQRQLGKQSLKCEIGPYLHEWEGYRWEGYIGLETSRWDITTSYRTVASQTLTRTHVHIGLQSQRDLHWCFLMQLGGRADDGINVDPPSLKDRLHHHGVLAGVYVAPNNLVFITQLSSAKAWWALHWSPVQVQIINSSYPILPWLRSKILIPSMILRT